jgi:hypothetical protein
MRLVQPRERGDVHVIPINDLREHVEKRTCWCQPILMDVAGTRARVVNHNAADGRELVEEHGVQ